MDHEHPIRRAVIILRCWLLMVTFIMTINANTASAALMSEATKPLPFYAMALVSLVWAFKVWDMTATIICCSILVVGTGLRGLEVLLYADAFSLTQRTTGTTLWLFISGSSLAFGVLGLIATSRLEAEELIYADGNTSQRSKR